MVFGCQTFHAKNLVTCTDRLNKTSPEALYHYNNNIRSLFVPCKAPKQQSILLYTVLIIIAATCLKINTLMSE